MKPTRVAILGFPGAMALDIVGPFDAFSVATIFDDDQRSQPCYEVFIIGLKKAAFVAETGLVFLPHKILDTAGAIDTLIVPGGVGLRRPAIQSSVSAWIRRAAPRIRRIATVCTGTYGVAPTGLLDGLRVTTHWRFAEDLARKFPRIQVDARALFYKQGKMYTCAGITAGIDLSLALIEEDHGPGVALAVARELVVYMKRPGGQEQYSEPLRFQTRATDRFADLAAWIQDHLRDDLSVERLAQRVHLSPRQFSRNFKMTFGSAPAAFVSELRLNEARNRLTFPRESVESVADSVGFKSADAFRRAFQQRFGLAPRDYKLHFASRTSA
jgi:transcriptional regulator GlxA family with amidase domain